MTLAHYTCTTSPTKRHIAATTERLTATCLYCGVTVERVNEGSSWWYVVIKSAP